MATVKKMGEIGPDMFHLEGTGVGSSNNSGGDKEKKNNLKAKRLDSYLKLIWVE